MYYLTLVKLLKALRRLQTAFIIDRNRLNNNVINIIIRSEKIHYQLRKHVILAD